MRTRPKTLDLFGAFLVTVAISFPIQIMVLYGHSPLELDAVFAKITWLNWLVMASMVANAYLVYNASPMIKYTIPVSVALVAFNNWVVAQYNADYSPLAASLASAAYLGVHGILLKKEIFQLFNHPERRWWMIAPRKKVEVAAYVSPYNGAAFKTKTFDLSEGGAFIPLTGEEAVTAASVRGVRPRKLVPNDRVSLCLTLGLAQIRCDAKVVRNVDARGHYPAGIGLSFEDLPRRQRRELKRYIEAMA